MRPIRPGDVLTRRSRISDIDERHGSTGPLVLTTETTYRDAAGEVVMVLRLHVDLTLGGDHRGRARLLGGSQGR